MLMCGVVHYWCSLLLLLVFFTTKAWTWHTCNKYATTCWCVELYTTGVLYYYYWCSLLLKRGHDTHVTSMQRHVDVWSCTLCFNCSSLYNQQPLNAANKLCAQCKYIVPHPPELFRTCTACTFFMQSLFACFRAFTISNLWAANC